jgi:hypothetical protein
MVDEKIVLVEFNSVLEGLDYINNLPDKFCFYVGGETYDINGDFMETPINSEIFGVNNICINIINNTSPGQLYISDGFIKYYKEIIIIS